MNKAQAIEKITAELYRDLKRYKQVQKERSDERRDFGNGSPLTLTESLEQVIQAQMGVLSSLGYARTVILEVEHLDEQNGTTCASELERLSIGVI